MEEAFIAFLEEHKRLFLTLHLIGVALGMGGATITDILFFNFLRDFKISAKEAGVMRTLSNVIMGALCLLTLSGAALFFSDMPRLSQSPAFLAKVTIVVVITVNGILMHKYIAPHMVHLSFLRHPIHAHHVMHNLRAVAFAMGAVSFVSWYSVFFIAMLKSYLPEDIRMLDILLGYLAVLFVALVVSQVLQKQYYRRFLG